MQAGPRPTVEPPPAPPDASPVVVRFVPREATPAREEARRQAWASILAMVEASQKRNPQAPPD